MSFSSSDKSALAKSSTDVYFLNKSLVTIEVQHGKIVQARTRFNELPTTEMDAVLKKWEKQIIPITNE